MSILKMLQPIASLKNYLEFKANRLRLAKLMNNGLRVGMNVYINEDVEFDEGYPYLIEIGNNCRIAKGVRILAHDATTFRDLGVTRLAPVRILEGTFIGERAIITPGVTLGPRAVIAAGSVVNRDIGEDRVAAGNPARPYGSFSGLLDKYRESLATTPIIRKADMEEGKTTQASVLQLLEDAAYVLLHGVPKSDPYYVNADMNMIRKNAEEAVDKAIESAKARPGKPNEDKETSA